MMVGLYIVISRTGFVLLDTNSYVRAKSYLRDNAEAVSVLLVAGDRTIKEMCTEFFT